MDTITLNSTIKEIVGRHPETLQVFIGNGFELFADEATLNNLGSVLKLKTALKSREIDPESFCQLLEEAVSAGASTPGRSLPMSAALEGGCTLFALLPCPLKVPLEEAFHAFLERLPEERRNSLTWCFEANANNLFSYDRYVEQFEEIDEMPDIIITPGFNSFFHGRFVERFIKTGMFTSVNIYAGDPQLAPLGVIDPAGHYTMLAMNLLVLVVDHSRLGHRPAPSSWKDLLGPVYEKSVAIRGNRDGSFCETLLMAIHKDFGMEGVKGLARSVRYGWHPSQMVKAAVSGAADAPAVSAMPLFFAATIGNRGDVSVVWPEDGALVSPVTMLVKTARRDQLKETVDFLTGPEVARICAGARFPALHPQVDNGLPPNAAFKWIGWEYVRQHDMKALIHEINETFMASFRGEKP